MIIWKYCYHGITHAPFLFYSKFDVWKPCKRYIIIYFSRIRYFACTYRHTVYSDSFSKNISSRSPNITSEKADVIFVFSVYLTNDLNLDKSMCDNRSIFNCILFRSYFLNINILNYVNVFHWVQILNILTLFILSASILSIMTQHCYKAIWTAITMHM